MEKYADKDEMERYVAVAERGKFAVEDKMETNFPEEDN